MKYQDLVLEISSIAGGGYAVEVDTAQGRRKETVRPKLHGSTASSPTNDRALGEALYRSLFVGAVGKAFERSLAAFQALQAEDTAKALRCKLVFGAPARQGLLGSRRKRLDLIRFASLPWELLCEGEASQPFALGAAHCLVRTFDVDLAVPAEPVKGTLRVLLVSCQPNDLAELNLAGEVESIKTCLEGQHMVEVEVLLNPNLTRLCQAMQARDRPPFHILHFLGHGGFQPQAGEGHLCLVDTTTHKAQRVAAQKLASQLRDRGLRLVVLNACRGAQLPVASDESPFGSVAVALLGAGIPAVVGMQKAISDPAAVAFARDFYSSLRSHGWVETAVTDARQGMLAEDGAGEGEWAIPALYMHPRAGQVFAFDNSRPEPERCAADPPLKLGLRSWDGWGQTQMKECDWVLNLAPQFKQRFLRDPAKWDRTIFRRLRSFFAEHLEEGRPIELQMAAHLSIAFALGFILDAKSGLDLSFLQRSQMGTETWSAKVGEVPPPPHWTFAEPLERDPQASDEVLVISVTRDALPGALDYLQQRKDLAVRRVQHAMIHGGPLHSAIASGAHACKAAQYLERERGVFDQRPAGATLHVFAAVPATFMFYLGQLAAPWGVIQLYEWDFQQQRTNSYEPSILLDSRELKPLKLRAGRS